ncbi:Uncharacterized protein YR821_0634 [Yersinia ruckeri]|uniref:Uncharacterized protein n=1 Tax=Yersinia ruckeri TaxID=29486 RepID=A0A0A8VFS0_YERRU|nr:Uncharacterized protein YR821_0634 [Yersinia ruckeri]CEK26461.1 hypothetical protein CSF007_3410 [Yersinia ruckeri]
MQWPINKINIRPDEYALSQDLASYAMLAHQNFPFSLQRSYANK